MVPCRLGLIVATSVDKRALDFVTGLMRGDNPLEAAVTAAMSEKSVAVYSTPRSSIARTCQTAGCVSL